ncbi:hypothetical protein [Merismopedia glauca]|uniref:Uncharacterized protein n=1 Tax=Merismopedia glauca CCAP 1448/3 TaxID=1296344 RepID=A0A2T1C8T7_9CYAN|nr:hypothetical protein [Merismopedia glauca]PSB04578.1 hypothetical protein C7B64_03200 [Merismopedia glauca CCAP 1448/3]
MQQTNDPELIGMRVPRVLWITMLISVVLLLFVGGMLFFQPDLAKIYWPWKLTPFNTRFLGAIYLSAIIPLLFCLIRPQSAPLRIVLPMFAFFTTYLLVVSGLYTDNMISGKKSVPIWFFLYGMDSFAGIYYLWNTRKQVLKVGSGRSPKWCQLYRFQAILLGVYGLGLLLLAPIFSSLWPWTLDSFHSHLYSGLFLASTLGLWLLSYSNLRSEHLMLNLTQAALGGLISIGLWVVDAQIHKLNWNSPNPWIWSSLFALFGLIGLLLSIFELRKQPD